MEIFKENKASAFCIDEKALFTLRYELVMKTDFTLDEVPLAYAFIKGDEEALPELKSFRQWKEKKRFIEAFNLSQQEE